MHLLSSTWNHTLFVALLVGALAGGCKPAPDSDTDAGAALRAAELRLLVVDDPALAAAIEAVAGEWKAISGATLHVAQATSSEAIAAKSLPGSPDAAIYPSWLLGTLAERGWITPLPEGFELNRELAWSDTFELSQVAETRWGQATLAVPLGSPVLTCLYRVDLFEKFHRRPPRTWDEFHELAEFFARRENLGDAAPPADAAWHGCVQPLANGAAAAVLLARAAPYVKHRDHYSALFNIDTMAPLINGAGFVRALDELVADARLGPQDARNFDIAAAREHLSAGRAALAIAWPGHERATSARPEAGRADAAPAKAAAGNAAAVAPDATAVAAAPARSAVSFVELPGSAKVYNIGVAAWENRPSDESEHVPLLGAAGRLGSLCQSASELRLAFQLLAWLSGKDWGGSTGAISSASPDTTLYRRSQLRQPRPWVDAGTDVEAARQYATSVRDALSRPAYLMAVRVPGHQRYLAALDAAVEAALAGTSASDALGAAAAEWSKITEELGRDAQRKAYRASLGLEP
ncbi:MAG: extracellular solute-binding protein [Pirellulales bacterium]